MMLSTTTVSSFVPIGSISHTFERHVEVGVAEVSPHLSGSYVFFLEQKKKKNTRV